MTADLGASAYLVDGVGLAASGVTLNNDGAGLWNGLNEDVATETFPGIDGGRITGGVFRPYLLTTSYTIRGSSAVDAWAKVQQLRRRCKPGRTVTLTRQMPDPDGTAANTPHTTVARRLGDRPIWLGVRGWVLEIDWWITEVWHGADVAIASVAGTQTILGDIDTHRITLTLAAGAARTVTNQSNGFWVSFTAAFPGSDMEIDVEARTATGVTDGVDYSRYLSWGKSQPFQLEAGDNTIALSAGTASLTYQPAYL